MDPFEGSKLGAKSRRARQLGILAGVVPTVAGTWAFVSPSGAAPVTTQQAPATLQELIAEQPSPGAPVVMEPGQTTLSPLDAWVKTELQLPGLTADEQYYLENQVPVSVTSSPPNPLLGQGVSASDPVASNNCWWKNGLGWTLMSYNSYEGFNDNGYKITRIYPPSDDAYSNGALEYYVDGSSWATSQPGPPTTFMTADDIQYFHSAILGIEDQAYEAKISYRLYGSGAWWAGVSCTP
jgi:hypothetical protein